MIREVCLAASATRTIAGMDVHAVAHQLRRDVVVLEYRGRETGLAMAERRHPVEQMCRLPRAGVDPGERLLVGGARVTERDVMAVRRQVANQIQRAVELRRNRQDADVRPGGGNLRREFRRPVNSPSGGCRAANRRQSTRLRALVFGVDEVAFEVRRQHPRRERGRACPARPPTAASIVRKRGRGACDRRRAKRGDAEPRKALRHRRDRVSALKRVEPVEPVHMDVDEPGDDVVIGEVEIA